MTQIEELEQEINTLKETVTAERGQVAAKLDEQNQNIAALEAQIAESGDSEKIRELINKVKAVNEDIRKIYETPDEAAEVDEEDEEN